MNAVDKLLAYDGGLIDTPTGEVKLRLKKLNGFEMTFPIKAVDPEVASELQEAIIEMDTKSKKMSMNGTYNVKVMTIVEGCPDVFKNKDLQKKFGAVSPKDLVKKILLDGEMEVLRSEIDRLSGFDEDEEKVKN